MNLAQGGSSKSDAGFSVDMGLREQLTLLERHILLETLSRANGVKKHAAAMLGIDARNLPYLLRKHHIFNSESPSPYPANTGYTHPVPE